MQVWDRTGQVYRVGIVRGIFPLCVAFGILGGILILGETRTHSTETYMPYHLVCGFAMLPLPLACIMGMVGFFYAHLLSRSTASPASLRAATRHVFFFSLSYPSVCVNIF